MRMIWRAVRSASRSAGSAGEETRSEPAGWSAPGVLRTQTGGAVTAAERLTIFCAVAVISVTG
ncbi:MAG: hypothetical protein PHF75_02530 [Gallionella sp.]|nr:hypothetical protein [Gallionella sp.]